MTVISLEEVLKASKEPSEEELFQVPFSEIALAARFVERHRHELRYVAEWGRWMRYSGGKWHYENTLLAFDLARKICRQAASEMNKKPERVTNARTIAAIERIAKADRAVAATVDQWDTDPWLLNTPKGTIDLRTRKMRPHDQNDYITKMTAVSPEGDCPTWKKHLKRILPDDDVVKFLQKYFGYALTGITSEDKWCFLHGEGRNGKDTTVETVSDIMGDYHVSAPSDVFTVTNFEAHPTEMARLRGARLVTVNELPAGKLWNEARIKHLTGGGPPISARFMRQDFFEYKPQLKLCFYGNKKPHLRSNDEATKARTNLVPFDQVIPEEERDIKFPEKLQPEWPGILAWLIEGCELWQKEGLKAPEAIRAATKAYLDREQGLHEWIEACCVLDPNAWEGSTELFNSWIRFRQADNAYVGNKNTFADMLDGSKDEFKLTKGRHHETRRKGYQGLRLIPTM
jgi:putative DNA primase/helicase